MKRWVAGAAVIAFLGGAVPRAEANEYWRDAGLGVACVFINVLYSPAKVTYAFLGSVTGGLGYLLTGLNTEVAETIWEPSVGGDYVVSREHLLRERTLYFSGTVLEEGNVSASPTSADDYGYAP